MQESILSQNVQKASDNDCLKMIMILIQNSKLDEFGIFQVVLYSKPLRRRNNNIFVCRFWNNRNLFGICSTFWMVFLKWNFFVSRWCCCMKMIKLFRKDIAPTICKLNFKFHLLLPFYWFSMFRIDTHLVSDNHA